VRQMKKWWNTIFWDKGKKFGAAGEKSQVAAGRFFCQHYYCITLTAKKQPQNKSLYRLRNSRKCGIVKLWGNKAHLKKGNKTMEAEITKPRLSTVLYSWDTALSAIGVKVNGLGHIEVRIGDITIVMSPKECEALELVKQFGVVEVETRTTGKIRV